MKRPLLMSRLGVVVLALLCTGCANPMHYYHRDRTLADFQRDHAACAHHAAYPPAPPEAKSGYVLSGVYRSCMLGKGWNRADGPGLPNYFRGIERDREWVFDELPKQPRVIATPPW